MKKLVAAAVSVLFATALHAQTWTFEHLAGSAGGAGFYDGQGSAARFSGPGRAAADSAGNVYVADADFTVRKISTSGLVTTLAGLAGVSGFEDDRGSAARFSNLGGITVDPSGNVYVGDAYTLIRRISPSGFVTTIAGNLGWTGSVDGTGIGARFNGVSGLAADASGNVYVADAWNAAIRKVTPDGVVTTVAGLAGFQGSTDGTGSAARFSFPQGIAIDGSGNLYVTDNATVRKITPDFKVTTLAGLAGVTGSTDGHGSAARFGSLVDVTVDSAGNVFVTDSLFSNVRKITPAGDVTTFVSSPAGLRNPYGITHDSSNALFVADSGNHVLRRVTTGGAVTTLAGDFGFGGTDGSGAAARFNKPWGMAVDSSGNVYVADSMNSTIRRITPAGVATTLAGTAGSPGFADGTGAAASFTMPRGVAVDAAGTVYVADTWNYTIRKITPDGVVTTLAGLAAQPGTADGNGSQARFEMPAALAVDAAGNIFVADLVANTIRKVAPDGTVSTLAGLPFECNTTDGAGSAARLCEPTSIGVDGSGNVWVYDSSARLLRKITPDGTVSTEMSLPGSTNGTQTNSLFVTPSGAIYYTDGAGDRVWRVDGTMQILGGASDRESSNDFTGATAGLGNPSGIAVDGAGNIYVAEYSGNSIRVGRPTTLPDEATIDAPAGSAGVQRQLGVSPLTATSFLWRVTRIPAGSSGPALSSATIANPTFTPDAGGRWEFVLRAEGAGGVRYSTVVLDTSGRPAAVVSGGGAICPGKSANATVLLYGTAPWNITWSDGLVMNGVTANIVVRPFSTPGTYSITSISDATATGTSSGSATVTAASPLTNVSASVTGRATFCTGETGGVASVDLTGGGNPTYQWGLRTTSGGPITPINGAVDPTLTLTPAVLGNGSKLLVVTVTACDVTMTSNEVPVAVNPRPEPVVTVAATVFAGSTTNVATVSDAGAGAIYSWSIDGGTIVSGGDTRQVVFAAGSSESLFITAAVANASSCTASALRMVEVRPAPAAENLYLVAPCRLFDSRDPAGEFGGPSLTPGGSRRIAAAGRCDIPYGADAIVATVTAVAPASNGWFTLFPADTLMPFVSTMNYRSGRTRANNAVVPLSAEGAFSAYSYNSSGVPADIIIDVTGYFSK